MLLFICLTAIEYQGEQYVYAV